MIKEKRGRAYAAKHTTRPVTVRMRTVPILSEERLGDIAVAALGIGAFLITGLLEAACK